MSLMRSTRYWWKLLSRIAPLWTGQLFEQRGAQAVDHRAFGLRVRVAGLHNDARIRRHPVVMHADAALLRSTDISATPAVSVSW